ncbi:MAG: DNA primase [Nitrospirae bacterium]|nr:DNA primase [Candidatus Manganitrophaceae bacterium]
MLGRRVPDQLIETIRDRTDLVAVISEYLALKKAGQNYLGLCPFHAEKSPSFTVSPSKQIFHCFGCGTGGNIFQFIMKMENLAFPEALRKLAGKAGVVIPEYTPKENPAVRGETDQIYRINEAAATYFQRNLLETPEGARAVDYLKKRGITPETIQAFSIGFSLPRRDDLLKQLGRQFPRPLLERAGLISRREGEETFFDRFRNRVLFPIRNLQGNVVGFGGRVLDDAQPKYLNTSETPVFTKGRHLFALDRAKKSGARSLIIVEGYFDVVAAHQAGITNVIATMGTALTEDHLRLIRRWTEKVFLLFDPDEAGARAAIRTAPLFITEGISAEVISLPPGEDPDLFIRRVGKEGFLSKLGEGKTLIDFAIAKLAEASSLKSIDDKIKVTEEIFPLIEKLKNKFEQGHYLKTLSETLNIEEPDLRAQFASRTKGKKEARPVSQALPAGARLPQGEEMIVSLLLQNQIDPSALSGLELDDFTDPQMRGILSHLWNAAEGRWSTPQNLEALDEMDESLLGLVRRLSIRENYFEDAPQTLKDCVASLQKKRMQRESIALQGKIREADRGGDSELIESLQRRLFELRRKLNQLNESL